MKQSIAKTFALTISLFAVIASSAFAAAPDVPTVVPPIYYYDVTFSQVTYSADGTIASLGDKLYAKGSQTSTNANYPSLNIQYAFVSKGSTPDSDILLTDPAYSTVGSYKKTGSYTLSFIFNAQANKTVTYLRMWNYNNYDGTNNAMTVHAWGNVTK